MSIIDNTVKSIIELLKECEDLELLYTIQCLLIADER